MTTRGHEPWLLPDGVEELLPRRAWRLEALRRRLLDLLFQRGYELVLPPLVEYLDSLLTGVGEDLDLETVKVTDQSTGRMMGVRADHTPQVARIDARLMHEQGPARLCYLGSVLHARPDDFGGAREPLQLGAELFGSRDTAADCEIIETMVALLQAAGVEGMHLTLGNVGVYRSLVAWSGIEPQLEHALHDALRRKSAPDVRALLENLPQEPRVLFATLLDLNGDRQVLARARDLLQPAGGETLRAIEQLDTVSGFVATSMPGISISIDVAELRGYRYHTGIVFSVYTPGHGRALAQGGRYDGVGAAFGRARGATGFSADLRDLIRLGAGTHAATPGIAAPFSADASLRGKVAELRASGERVFYILPDEPAGELRKKCDRTLQQRRGEWLIEKLTD